VPLGALRFSRRLGVFTLEHLEHAVGHDVAAHDVDARGDDGEESQGDAELRAAETAQQRPDDGDPGDRVAAGHQRGVQA